MSDVVEKLEIALKYQEPVDLIPKEYQEIVKAVAPPLIYRSVEELKWLSITENGEHIERIYIEACLNLDEIRPGSLKHPSGDIVNSRFPGVRRQLRQDGWFIVPLSQHKTADLQFEFEYRSTRTSLLVAGIEFQPCEEKVGSLLLMVELQVFEEYQEIDEAASQTLVYRSLRELKQILSKGVHPNGYKTWFSLNEKGEHCHMISMKDCLIPNEDFPSQYKSNRWSRFPGGLYLTNNKGFKTHVKTRLLSPSITYTINLVFYASSDYQTYVDLKYRLRGETTTSTVYLANRRDAVLGQIGSNPTQWVIIPAVKCGSYRKAVT
ncbi:hypothetical protein Tco_1454117, partial [Tanacetum coccineum]